METLINELTDSIVDFTVKYTNVSREVKYFVNNKNIEIKSSDKIDDLVTKNLCSERDLDILTDVFEIIQKVRKNSISSEDRKEKKKCKYNNRGYCKFSDKCTFQHSVNICEEFLKEDACKSKRCNFRHPKHCRYWMKKAEGCHRNENCQYQHDKSRN